MKEKLIRWGIVYGSAMAGALGMWLLSNWMPNLMIYIGGAGAGYLAWMLTKKK